MIIIGEKLNSSIPATLEAFTNHDADAVTSLIRRQAESGAHYLDINTALTGEDEAENLKWVIDLALEHCGCGIMIDSPNPVVIMQCAEYAQGRSLLINSVTLDAKYDALLDTASALDAGVVCLPLGDKGAQNARKRLKNAIALAEKLELKGIAPDKIFIDVLVEAVATGGDKALQALETLSLIKTEVQGINTIAGLSNVSFGLPKRGGINSAFLAMMMLRGLDSAIMDVTSPTMRDTLAASNALLGKDEYCLEYIAHTRQVI